MSIFAGPNIVNNQNLILCLDAANIRSYPGNGTQWYDISGNNNHATLVGATIQNGYCNFTGNGESDGDPAGDHVVVTENITRTDNYPNGCTYEFWLNLEVKQPNGQCILYGAATTRHIELKSASFRTEAARQNNYSFGTSTIPGGVNTNEWVMYTIVFANNEVNRPVRWYKNGLLFHTGTLDGGTFPGTEYFSFNRIGRSTGSSSFVYSESLYGKISRLCIYNYGLTNQEIIQNFKAQRGRFNL